MPQVEIHMSGTDEGGHSSNYYPKYKVEVTDSTLQSLVEDFRNSMKGGPGKHFGIYERKTDEGGQLFAVRFSEVAMIL